LLGERPEIVIFERIGLGNFVKANER